MNDCLVEVELPVPLFKSFTYHYDQCDTEAFTRGCMVEVELGKRRMHGVVTGFHDDRETKDRKLKQVISRIPVIPLRTWQLRLAHALSYRYFATLGEVLGLFIPPYRSSWKDLADWRVIPTSPDHTVFREEGEKNFYLWKKEHKLRKADIDRMVDRGEIILIQTTARRYSTPVPQPQNAEFLWRSLPYWEDRNVFFHQLVGDCLRTGKKVLLVFPDGGALNQAVLRFREGFPQLRVIQYDGRLTKRDRYLFHLKAEEGDYDIICGTHIACFLPLDHVMVHVVVDPEERGHVSDHSPRYDSLQVLRYKVELTGGRLEAVGTSPDLNLFYGLREGTFLEHNIVTTHSPRIDRTIQSVILDRKRSVLSMTARLAIGRTLGRGGRAIVWIQKSGYSGALGCRDCGFYYTCPTCDTAYRYIRDNNTLLCPLCRQRDEPKATCPRCSGVWFDYWGYATESAYEEIRKGFPGRDIHMVEGEGDWGSGQVPLPRPGLLVGTTAVLKESILRSSELLILASLDEWMRIPDFRARERLFLLMKKVLIYLGVDVVPSPSIIIQTSSIFEKQVSSLFEEASSFYQVELEKRKRIGYPPYVGLLRIITLAGNTEKRNRVSNLLVQDIQEAGYMACGPYSIAGLRKRGAISDEIIVHYPCEQLEGLYALVKRILSTRKKNGVRVEFEMIS